MWRYVGHPVAKAILAFGDGNYGEVVRLLRPVRTMASRFGGSHAQRDVIDLTLIEAAPRSGQKSLATALAAERVAVKPRSPFARLFVQRAEGLAPTAERRVSSRPASQPLPTGDGDTARLSAFARPPASSSRPNVISIAAHGSQQNLSAK